MERLERILRRAISVRRHYPKSREYALSLLLEWKGAETCRLAVEAVVSCAVREDSVLRERARQWVSQERENPLVHACLLDVAKRSEARRGAVLRLMDDLGVELSHPARSVWRAMREDTPSWPDIAKACGARWENFPAEGTPFEACLAVMEDNPEEDFSVILEDVLNHNLADMPELRKQVVDLSLKIPGIVSVVARHAGGLAEELAKLLVSADDPGDTRRYQDDSEAYAKALWAVSHALASFLSQCKELSPGQQRAVKTLLLDTKRPCRPWVAACGALLAPFASSSEEKISFLARAWRRRRPFVPEALDASQELEAYVYQLLPEEQAAFAQRTLELGSVTSLRDTLGVWLFGQIAEDATVHGDILLGTLEHVTPGVMLEYLDYSTGRADVGLVQRWIDELVKEREHPPASHRLITYLKGMGCSLSPLLWHQWEEALKVGYQLRPDDLVNPEIVPRLLEKGRERLVWENEQWRDVLLRHSPTATVVASFIFYAGRRSGDEVTWASDVLFPLCDERPALWRALMEVAWGETPSSLAQFLVLRRGMSAEETALARAVILKNPWLWLRVEELKCGVFEKLFSVDEQVDVFFAHAKEGCLPRPFLFNHLFSEEGARKRLLAWMLAHRTDSDSIEWVEWVKYYEFVGDRRVRNHLAHIILSSRAHKDEVDAALAALGL